MRKLIHSSVLFAALAGAGACASPGTLPGGPVDSAAPTVVGIRPDTNRVNVADGSVTFQLDDVVSERPQRFTNLADLFLISPSRGRNSVGWHRTRLVVRPEGGFRPGTTYRVQMLPGLTDLDGNVDSAGFTLVFSTGSTIAKGRLSGNVFDWTAEKHAPEALVEAIVLPDSMLYTTIADSLGRFELTNMPPGSYVLRAAVDQNRNRLIEGRELWDTVTVALQDSAVRNLHTLVRDTVGPGISVVERVDSMRLRLRFDRAIDTALALTPAMFSIKTQDSSIVGIARVMGGRAAKRADEDSARARAVRDSIRNAADTAAQRDTTSRPQEVRPTPVARAAAAAREAAARLTGRGRDTTDTIPKPKPTVAIPDLEVIILTAAPLPANTRLRVRAVGIRGVVGRTRTQGSERLMTTPKADTTKRAATPAPRDTGSYAAGSVRPVPGPLRAWLRPRA